MNAPFSPMAPDAPQVASLGRTIALRNVTTWEEAHEQWRLSAEQAK